MTINLNNPIIDLCLKGARAEFEGKKDRACELYRQAWEAATDDYEACIAAHYMARCQNSSEEILRWNEEALKRANKVKDARVKHFYPSLYLNLGRSFELLGKQGEAKKYYSLASELGFPHQMD